MSTDDGDDVVLELEDVIAGYGDSEVLHGLSFSVREGEVVALVGRNGVGKTTTLRSILGVITPRTGRVTYRGDDVTSLEATETVRRGMALVPEDRRIFPELTVRENLELASLGGSNAGVRLSIDEALDRFESLAERIENLGSSLSGGEQQMLTIARALVGGADLIMLDEPTEGLAPFIVQDVMRAVRELNEQGITVLFVEQNVQVALELADRIYIMEQGAIVYEGTPDDLARDQRILDRYLGVSA
ncbi:MAG: ABC transporter ATP-binding protein [Halobacteriota archaeon]